MTLESNVTTASASATDNDNNQFKKKDRDSNPITSRRLWERLHQKRQSVSSYCFNSNMITNDHNSRLIEQEKSPPSSHDHTVLYVDRSGIPAPFSLCYHATASRDISSSLMTRIPTSTITEIETVYCPQCLFYASYSTSTAAATTTDSGGTLLSSSHPASASSGISSLSSKAKGKCPAPQCRSCPICVSPLSIAMIPSASSSSSSSSSENGISGIHKGKNKDGNNNYKPELECYYKCSYCRWTSHECDVVLNIPLAISPSSSLLLRRKTTKTTTTGHADEEKLLEKEKSELANKKKEAPAQLAALLDTRIQTVEVESKAGLAFQKLLNSWGQKAKDEERKRRYGHVITTNTHIHSQLEKEDQEYQNKNDESMNIWSIQSLHQSVKEKKKSYFQRELEPVVDLTSSNEDLSSSSPAAGTTSSMFFPPSSGIGMNNFTTVQEQVHQCLNYSASQLPSNVTSPLSSSSEAVSSPLFPLHIPLRPKYSRRCRAELQAKRPGILIKPKTNPLEGDSSQKTGHGQWWKKDSSAIHILPKVTMVRHFTTSSQNHTDDCSENYHAIVLKINNPTLGLVRFRLNSKITKDKCKDMDTVVVRDLIMNHITDRKVDAKLLSDSLNTEKTTSSFITETIELEPAEDAFMDFGGDTTSGAGGSSMNTTSKRATKAEPIFVKQWNGESAIQNFIVMMNMDNDTSNNNKNEEEEKKQPKEGEDKEDSSTLSSSSINNWKILQSHRDTAWIQLVFKDDEDMEEVLDCDDEGKMLYRAMYIALEIEIGNGSWETSLIQPLNKNNGADNEQSKDDVDMVSFPLLLVWNAF